MREQLARAYHDVRRARDHHTDHHGVGCDATLDQEATALRAVLATDYGVNLDDPAARHAVTAVLHLAIDHAVTAGPGAFQRTLAAASCAAVGAQDLAEAIEVHR